MADAEKELLIEKQHRKELCRIALANGCFIECLDNLERLLKNERDRHLVQLGWTAFVVSYSRPFTDNDNLGQESSKLVAAEYKDLHDRVTKKYRNECVAHHDPTSLDLNELIFTVENSAIRLDPLRYHPTQEELQSCYAMVESVYKESLSRFQKCLERYPEVASFADGYYRFHFDQLKGSEWEPYVQNPMG